MVGQIGNLGSTSTVLKGTIGGYTEELGKVEEVAGTKGEKPQSLSQPYQKEQLENVVNGMNDFLAASPNTHLKFEFHEKLNEYYVTIIDDKTKEVVREIPPKKMLDMFAAMTEYIGLMVDKKI